MKRVDRQRTPKNIGTQDHDLDKTSAYVNVVMRRTSVADVRVIKRI